MKKILFITGLTLASVLALTGCGDNANETAAIDNLSHQLDRVTNTVSAVSNGNDKTLDVDMISQTQPYEGLNGTYESINQSNQTIANTKSQILQKVKTIKKQLVDGVKLGNSNTNAISELTTAMQRYNNNLGKTKSDYNRSISGISKLKNNPDDKMMGAKLTRLSCCMSARECYLKNILSSLESIENILNGVENSYDDNSAEEYEQYDESQMQFDNTTIEQPQQETQMPQNAEIMNGNYTLPYNSNGINNGAFNGAYGYGNGYNNAYGYGNGYGFNKFNPSRNTDTYGPGVTNIDTYRFNHNPNNAFRNGAFGGYAPLNQGETITEENNADQQNITAQDSSDLQNQNDVIEPTTETANIKFENPRPQPRENVNKKAPHPATTREQTEENTQEIIEGEDEIQQPMETNPEEQDLKIKTVSLVEENNNSENENTQNLEVKTEEKPAEETITGSDKPKGHTKTLANISLDINKKIKDLIKG